MGAVDGDAEDGEADGAFDEEEGAAVGYLEEPEVLAVLVVVVWRRGAYLAAGVLEVGV